MRYHTPKGEGKQYQILTQGLILKEGEIYSQNQHYTADYVSV